MKIRIKANIYFKGIPGTAFFKALAMKLPDGSHTLAILENGVTEIVHNDTLPYDTVVCENDVTLIGDVEMPVMKHVTNIGMLAEAAIDGVLHRNPSAFDVLDCDPEDAFIYMTEVSFFNEDESVSLKAPSDLSNYLFLA